MFEALKRTTGAPTREDWNRLLEHLEALPVTPGPGMLMRRTPGGTTLWPRKRRGGGVGEDSIAFKIYGVRLDGSAYKCKVRAGWVRTINPDSSAPDPVKDWMPVDGSDVPLDATAADEPAGPPEFTIANGQTIYCRVKTTAKGIIEEAPKIEVADTPEAGEHFQPPNADVEGDLYFPIANVEISGDPAVVSIEQIQQGGPIVVVPNLPEHKNVGGKREVSMGRTPSGDSYDFRTIEQLEGRGEAILKDLDPGDAEADPPVAPEEEGETIPFRRIAERVTQPQVRVTLDGDDIVQIEGNGYDDTYSDIFGGSIQFTDGLATGVTPPSAEGLTASFNWTFTPPGVSDPEEMRLTFTNGILTSATRKASGGAHEAVAPDAAVTFATYDTN